MSMLNFLYSVVKDAWLHTFLAASAFPSSVLFSSPSLGSGSGDSLIDKDNHCITLIMCYTISKQAERNEDNVVIDKTQDP